MSRATDLERRLVAAEGRATDLERRLGEAMEERAQAEARGYPAAALKECLQMYCSYRKNNNYDHPLHHPQKTGKMVRTFGPNQLGMLINMLQQVQSDGNRQQACPPPNKMSSGGRIRTREKYRREREELERLKREREESERWYKKSSH